MDMQCRGIMIVASILLATTVLTSSATTVEVFVANSTNATGPARATVPSCRRGTMQPKVAAKCWIAILEVPLCVFQIVEVFEGGSVLRVGKACCHAFVDLTDECKIEVFQKSKFFPVIEKFCSLIGDDDVQAPSPSPSPVSA